MKKIRKNAVEYLSGAALITAVAMVIVTVYCCRKADGPTDSPSSGSSSAGQTGAADRIAAYAAENGISVREWPDELIALLERNPDAEQFVLGYPLKKGTAEATDLSDLVGCTSVPRLYQWDSRWGYTYYGDTVMGLSGCGPTCLSMVCIYLTGDTKFDPRYIADFSQQNGYCIAGNGSAWALISDGGRKLGLTVTEIPLVESRVMRNLEAGNPIICIMGPGDFTTSGHFIVMTGCSDGKITVNDPNSKQNSAKLWNYDDIKGQIRNLWVCRK